MRPDASENSQINPSSIVRAARAAGSQPYLPSGFTGRCKIATLHAGFGVIRGMSGKMTNDAVRGVSDEATNFRVGMCVLCPSGSLCGLSDYSLDQPARLAH